MRTVANSSSPLWAAVAATYKNDTLTIVECVHDSSCTMAVLNKEIKAAWTPRGGKYLSEEEKNYRPIGFPCRFNNKFKKCKHNGVCSHEYHTWGMCDTCGNWKRKNRIGFNNNI